MMCYRNMNWQTYASQLYMPIFLFLGSSLFFFQPAVLFAFQCNAFSSRWENKALDLSVTVVKCKYIVMVRVD